MAFFPKGGLLLRYLILFTTAALTLAAQSLRIESGAFDDQVFQRDETGRASLALAGTAAAGRPVEVRVTGRYGVVPGIEATRAETSAAGRWSARLTLPVGGPYQIEASSGQAAASVRNVLVGDLWVLGGQSNMEGYGDLVDLQPSHGLVHSFDMLDRWVLAEEPLHLLPGAADRVHWRKNAAGAAERWEGARLAEFIATRTKGSGLALPFAEEMVRRTGVPIGLVPCAHGGTSMDQWSPDLRDRGGDSLYGATIRRVKAVGGRVRGILWYQGESDASPKAMPEFAAKFRALVAAFRSDLGQADLPFYYVQIGRHTSLANVSEWNAVQDLQRKAEQEISRTGMVTAVDLELDDQIHIGTGDLKRLGRRMANLACHDLFPAVAGCGALRRGPRPGAVEVTQNQLRIRFEDTNGRLRSRGRIAGFSIHGPDGGVLPLIYRAAFDPANPATVVLKLNSRPPAGATVRYGAGKDPLCTVLDEADMALPAFTMAIP